MDPTLITTLLAVPGSFVLGSYNFVFSHNVIPHLYNIPPPISTPMFDRIFSIASATIAPTAAVAISSYGYLAYSTSDPTKRRLYSTAAVLMAATLPLTAVVMKPGIDRLVEIGRNGELQAKAGVDKEVLALFKTWVKQNYFRSSLHITAGVLGLYAALS